MSQCTRTKNLIQRAAWFKSFWPRTEGDDASRPRPFPTKCGLFGFAVLPFAFLVSE
jgi:hypothetical protein